MGDVLRTTREPMVGAIRLAWWRERLEQLGSEVPAEPRLQAVAEQLVPRGIGGRDVAALEGGWARLLDDFPWDVATAEAIWFRGRHLFALGARLVGEPTEAIAAAGGLWALADAARRCSDPPSREMLLEQVRTLGRGLGGERFAVALRPLSMLAALALRDAGRGEPFEREGAPGRVAALLRHRLSGRLPRL
jgi:phytoene synthase